MKETLQITLRKNRRSEDLIQIARKIRGEKISHSYNQLNPPLPVVEEFTEAEQFEIEWFDQMVKFFLEHLNSNATDLERYRLFLPESLYQAMFELHQKCQKHNIDYRPIDSMLKSIVNKIKITERKLFEKTGIESNILEGINFKEVHYSEDDLSAQKTSILFKTLLEVPDFFNRFNQLAIQDYKKNSKVKIGHFKRYAQGHSIPSKWICACAMDVISETRNPFNILSDNELPGLWPFLMATRLQPNLI